MGELSPRRHGRGFVRTLLAMRRRIPRVAEGRRRGPEESATKYRVNDEKWLPRERVPAAKLQTKARGRIGMHISMKMRGHSDGLCFLWLVLLLASCSVIAQPKAQSTSEPASFPVAPMTSKSGTLPVISPPDPVIGGLPWLIIAKDRFITDSAEIKFHIRNSENPQKNLEDFRIAMEQARRTLEQDRRDKNITKEEYVRDMESYRRSIDAYRELQK
ncbi:hypothetical protein [Paracidovorax avenae]|uniref:hypothetical protein n=1 Tax=Paracidovorax avenae TaxID=80867 RepID=UPI0012FE65A8|nr:hypothetical protein [Paracidovorax avenae]